MKKTLFSLGMALPLLAGAWDIPSTHFTAPFTTNAYEDERFQKVYDATLELNRDDTRKLHGCVKGKLTVPGNLSSKYRQGIFQAGESYETYIRFSNQTKNHDNKSDLRNLEIKVLDPERGPEELYGHDFILTDSETHFVRTPEELVDYWHFKELNRLPTFSRLELLAKGSTHGFKKHSLFDSGYYSQTHYRFGKEIVRYGVFNCKKQASHRESKGENHFSKNLQREAGHGLCLEFKIQLYSESDKKVAIGDYTRAWNAPYRTVGKMEFYPQWYEAHNNICSRIDMDRFHTIEEHKPIGDLNKGLWYIEKGTR